MHISEGILSPAILIPAWGVTAISVGYSLKKMEFEEMPKVAVFSALFFIASFIHVPLGPTSVHLLLNGLLGVVLGFASLPAIFVALALQGILFGFGGISTLGVNTLTMALPALIVWQFFTKMTPVPLGIRSFLSGFLSVFLSSLLLSLVLYFNGDAFIETAQLAFAANIPVMVIEGIILYFAVRFLQKVYPEMLTR